MKKLALAVAAISFFCILSFAGDSHPTAIQGFVTDSACAAHGKKTCSDKTHVMKDNPLVLVSDSDATIFTLVHPGKLADHQGQHVEVNGLVDRAQKRIEVKDFITLN